MDRTIPAEARPAFTPADCLPACHIDGRHSPLCPQHPHIADPRLAAMVHLQQGPCSCGRGLTLRRLGSIAGYVCIPCLRAKGLMK